MGAYSWVCIGEDPRLPLAGAARETYSTAHAALFLDSEHVERGLYVSTVKTLRDRLQLLGVTAEHANTVVDAEWHGRENVDDEDKDISPDSLIGAYLHAGFKEDPESGGWNPAAEKLVAAWGYIWREDHAQLRYLLDRLPDDHVIAFDLSEVVGAGYVEWTSTLCADARAMEAASAQGTMPTIVLTEGTTDAEFLKDGLALLRPDLLGFLTFMDYSQKPEGGAGAVSNGLKAFSAAGVGNHVIGLYDNDTAGRTALSSLNKGPKLRPNLKATTLPQLELASNYPASGPDGTNHADINGRAVSIELFFGPDVLAKNGALVPIQWTAYEKGIASYQGEITGKKELQNDFRKKLSRGIEKPEEWNDFMSVLNHLITVAGTFSHELPTTAP